MIINIIFVNILYRHNSKRVSTVTLVTNQLPNLSCKLLCNDFLVHLKIDQKLVLSFYSSAAAMAASVVISGSSS